MVGPPGKNLSAALHRPDGPIPAGSDSRMSAPHTYGRPRRSPGVARPGLDPRSVDEAGSLPAAVAGGLVHPVVLLATWTWATGSPAETWRLLFDAQVGPWLWWATAGGALVGAVWAVALLRDGLVAPLLGVALLYGVAVHQTWRLLRAPEPVLPGTPLDLYLVGWPLVLALAVALGVAERRLRSRPTGDGRSGEA